MKNLLYLFAAFLVLSGCNSEGGSSTAAGGDLATSLDSMSYAVGVNLAQQLKAEGISLNGASASTGFTEALGGAELDLAYQKVLRDFQLARQAKGGQPFTDAEPKTFSVDSLSYFAGFNVAKQMSQLNADLDVSRFQQGCEDEIGEKSLLGEEMLAAQFNKIDQLAQAQAQAAAAENIEKGKAFIAEKAQEEGVTATASGLHYKVLTKGSGTSPVATDKVKVHYEGRLIDGKVFDSSYQRGQPIEFALNGVIPGWTEGVQLMKPGAKYQFYIPENLAYGSRGSGPDIGPGETLIFDVELLEVVK